METYFVDVILPLHLPDTYTYRVPQDYNDTIKVGQRVVVQFGAKKLYSALVRRIHQEAPKFTTKYVLAVIDIDPIVGERQFRLWEWMARYYMCGIGDVMALALPSSLRIASESVVAIHPDFQGDLTNLSINEVKVVTLLSEHTTLSVADVSHALGIKQIMSLLNGMIERQIIIMDEDIKQRFNPRTATYISLASEYRDSEKAKELFDQMEKVQTKHKQLDALLYFMQLSHLGADTIPKKSLTDKKDLSQSAINTLIKNGILITEQRVESRLIQYAGTDMLSAADIQLNECQQKAYQYISSDSHNVSLLYGVTSSGKTEVYIKLIHDTLQRGQQALFLLPEIALTAQLINRLRRYFGDAVGVYHSRFSPSQRAEVWYRSANPDPEQGYRVLIGARSALFLPFHNLGLVVVDEEHDPSYKQAEPAPRYQGRDCAVYLAHIWGCHTVLGSATPSVESYFSATTGKYGLAVMDKRYGNWRLPEVYCADLKEATRHKEVCGNFSNFLLQHISDALEHQQQVILFQNRRGFSLRLECDDCHWTPQCQNCDVSLVYHKNSNSLRCHYCGYTMPLPNECPACHSHHIKMKGFGTERAEEDLTLLFPEARVARMDLDSTTQKNRYIEILNDFEDRKIDILVGTQMITKGLDFSNVSVVGILSADNLIFFPDYRAFERAYQLMTQVSGRAGRHGEGKVIIQTFNPYHQAIRDVIDNNYERMYASQIQERRVFRYPPYYRLIKITLRHRSQDLLNDAADYAAQALRAQFGARVLGPEYPSISRIRNLYIKQIMLRFERTEAIASAKELIMEILDQTQHLKEYSPLIVAIDVDPE